MSERRRIVWPEGEPEKAVVTNGLLSRWWTEFRMGWSFNPRKLRRVHSAWGNYIDWNDPVFEARYWEHVLTGKLASPALRALDDKEG